MQNKTTNKGWERYQNLSQPFSYGNHVSFIFVSDYFRDFVPPKQTFISQLRNVESVIEQEVAPNNVKALITPIENTFICNDIELLETDAFYITIKDLLWVEFYGNDTNMSSS